MERYSHAKGFGDEALFESDGRALDGVSGRETEVRNAETDTQHHVSVFGRSLRFKGELTADEDLLIQGHVQGSIRHNAKNLTIGVHGEAKADIVARQVIVQGKVQGDIRASESLVIEASAQVHGNLFAPRIALKDGAKFKGSIDMEVDVERDVSSNVGAFRVDEDAKGKASSSVAGRPNDTEEGSEELPEARVADILR